MIATANPFELFRITKTKKHMGTSNNDDFVVGSTPVAARRSFSLLIWRGYVSAFCGSAPFRALQANRAIMRQPSAPASQAGGYYRRDSADRSWLSPARYRSSVQSDRPARFAEHRTRARREPEPCSSGGSRSPALSIAHDCGSHADECDCASRAL